MPSTETAMLDAERAKASFSVSDLTKIVVRTRSRRAHWYIGGGSVYAVDSTVCRMVVVLMVPRPCIQVKDRADVLAKYLPKFSTGPFANQVVSSPAFVPPLLADVG